MNRYLLSFRKGSAGIKIRPQKDSPGYDGTRKIRYTFASTTLCSICLEIKKRGKEKKMILFLDFLVADGVQAPAALSVKDLTLKPSFSCDSR